MAGSDPNFDATAFRAAIRSTMQLGAPSNVADQATFRWNKAKTFAQQDSTGMPYDWTSTPLTDVEQPDVKVPVAVQFTAGASYNNGVGSFTASKVVLTVLDVDFALVQGADQVLIGQRVFNILFYGPPVGLFDVTVYEIHAEGT